MSKLSYQVLRLIESKDPEGKDWEVVLIQAGKSLNRKIYPAQVLKDALSLFENAKAAAYEYVGNTVWNHLPESVKRALPEGCVKNIVGWYDNIRYGSFKDEEGRPQEGVLGRLHIAENADKLRKFLRDAWEHGKKTLLGFSIDGDGEIREVNDGNGKAWEVKRINRIDEVTIVTNPAAGGQLIRLLAGLTEEEIEMNWLKRLYDFAKGFKESLVEGIDSAKITEDQEISLIKSIIESADFPPKAKEKIAEAAPFTSDMVDRLIELMESSKVKEAVTLLKSLKEKMACADGYGYPYKKEKVEESEEAKKAREAAEAKKTKEAEDAKKAKEAADATKSADQKKIDEALDRINKIEEATKKANSIAVLNKVLSESDLPAPIKDKIKTQFSGKIFEEAAVKESIQMEKEVLGKLQESGNIRGMGNTKIDVRLDESDKLQVAIDKMIDDEAVVPDNMKNIPGFTSLREAYRTLHPEDPNVTGKVDRARQYSRLTEAITTADFTYALGTSMTRKLVREYAKKPFLFAPLVSEVPIDNFKQQERVKWGGYSTLPAITEDAAYVDLYEPKDEEATYTAGTKGGFVSVSRKTIKNDDLGLIKRIPSMVTKAAKKTLERDVITLLLANGTYTPHNTTLFSTVHANYSADSLGNDSLTDSKDRISNHRERGSARTAGTATSATSTTICDTGNATIVDNAYNGYYIRIVYGTGAGQTRLISATATAASTITVSTAWTTTPSTDSKYEVSFATNDDEIVGFEAAYIIYGNKLRAKVGSLLNSEKNPENVAEDNIHKGTLKPIYCPMIEGSTYQYYWFLAIDKSDADVIEVGYIDNQKEPTLVIQDQPALGEVFTNDRIRWRIRYEYGLAVVECSGLDGNFATAI